VTYILTPFLFFNYFKFIGATGLPKMDIIGSADPYFVAKFERLSFVLVFHLLFFCFETFSIF